LECVCDFDFNLDFNVQCFGETVLECVDVAAGRMGVNGEKGDGEQRDATDCVTIAGEDDACSCCFRCCWSWKVWIDDGFSVECAH